MGTIKVETEKLLEFANKMLDLKEEFNLMMKEISSIEDSLNNVKDVSTYSQKDELYHIEEIGYIISREFENLAEDLNYASKEYENADKTIKNSIESMTIQHMNENVKRLNDGKDMILPLPVPGEFADYLNYLFSKEEAKKYLAGKFFGTYIGDKQIQDLPSRIAYIENGYLYIYELQDYVEEVPNFLSGFDKVNYNDHFRESPGLLSVAGRYKYECIYNDKPESDALNAMATVATLALTKGKSSKEAISKIVAKEEDTLTNEVAKIVEKEVVKTKPNQIHHFATNKSKKYTQQFEEITKKYKLDLDEDWNKKLLPHQGRHPYAYHDYVLEQMKKFDKISKGDQEKFLKLYGQLKKKVMDNPEMLYKEYWTK